MSIPSHIAIIMDGNGRWAQSKNYPRLVGHKHGVNAARTAVESAIKNEVSNLTLFALSLDNNQRPSSEIKNINELLANSINSHIEELYSIGVKINFFGELSLFDPRTQQLLYDVQDRTKKNTRLNLFIALNYSGRWDITQALKKSLKSNSTDFDIYSALPSAHIPDIDLLIRTGGQRRISNFLLWQLIYAELYFTDTYWPDFNKQDFDSAIMWYTKQNRTFGGLNGVFKKAK